MTTPDDAPPVADAIELLSSDEIRLLSALGFMAARAGHVVPAVRIFEGLALLRKDKAFPYIGLALAMICVGAYGDAVRVLEERGLAACPGDVEINAYLGLALRLAGRFSEADALAMRLDSGAELPQVLRTLMVTVAALGVRPSSSAAWPQPAPVLPETETSGSS